MTTDDDIRVEPDWLDRIAAGFEAHGCDYIGGRVLPVWPGDVPDWLPARNEVLCGVLAVLDFGLGGDEVTAVLREALEMVAGRVRYSLRELMGTLIGMRRPAMRARTNPLSRPHSLFCSAFVTHVLRKAGIDPTPGLDVKHTAPEDLFRSPLAAGIWLLQPPQAAKAPLKELIVARVKKRLGR